MKNLIYDGVVSHQRFKPKNHSFNYRVNYFYFNLDEASRLITFKPFLSFHPKNYLTSKEVRHEIGKKEFPNALEVESIYILTQLTYFGFCFNPVSFYYCFNTSNELTCIVTQITNTPWGEKHVDVIDFQKDKGELQFPKEFHVSPFMPMDIQYNWKMSIPAKTLKVKMLSRMHNEQEYFFNAEMNLVAKAYNSTTVFLSLLKFPLMSFKVMGAIYWQALLLYSKKIPFYIHPKKREVT